MRYQHILGKPDLDRPFLVSLRLLFRSPPGFIFVSFCIFYFSIFQYLRYANYRDPTSAFFDPSRAYDRIYSNRRIEEAKNFIESVDENTPSFGGTTRPMMCVGVATVARRGEQYVRTTIGSLLEGLPPSDRQTMYLSLLLGHTEPSKHPIHNEPWVKLLPNNVLAYKDSDMEQIRKWENAGMYRNKTIFDYTYLMKSCYDTGAQYIAMLEDDVLAARGWFPEALESLAKVEAQMKRRRTQSQWIYLRLFYQEALLGWNSEFWFSYLSWSLSLWSSAVPLMFWLRNRSRRAQSILTDLSVLIILCVCIPLSICLYFMAGRNTVLPLSNGVHEMNKYGCCSQGYIFPREVVPAFLSKTDLETDWLVDMMVEQIADKEGYSRWATTPALLQHIGTTSSKGWGFDKSAQAIWNFGFELRS